MGEKHNNGNNGIQIFDLEQLDTQQQTIAVQH